MVWKTPKIRRHDVRTCFYGGHGRLVDCGGSRCASGKHFTGSITLKFRVLCCLLTVAPVVTQGSHSVPLFAPPTAKAEASATTALSSFHFNHKFKPKDLWPSVYCLYRPPSSKKYT